MKVQATMALLVLGLFGSCANDTQPFLIDRVLPLQPNCVIPTDTTLFLPGGTLDVAAGTPQYFAAVRLISLTENRSPAVTLRTGEVLESAGRNSPVITQQVINYKLSKRLGATPKPFLLNVSLPFNEAGEIIAPIQFISQDFGQQLFDGVTASTTLEDFVDVTVELEFKGEYTATRTPFSTGVFTFPIRVVRSAPTPCADPTQVFTRFPTDACTYVGQAIGVAPTSPPSACCKPGTVGC